MSLLALVITLVLIGVILYLVEKYIPMDATIKRIIHIVVVIAVVLWLLALFGVLGEVSNMPVPKVR